MAYDCVLRAESSMTADGTACSGRAIVPCESSGARQGVAKLNDRRLDAFVRLGEMLRVAHITTCAADGDGGQTAGRRRRITVPEIPIAAWIALKTIRPESNTCSVETTSTGIQTSSSHATMTMISTRPRTGVHE